MTSPGAKASTKPCIPDSPSCACSPLLRALINAGHFDLEERPNPASRGRACKHLVPADPEAETEEETDADPDAETNE
ncbi:MAG: hypothetical protein JO312_04325 [Hyphomicrobiales bacterium]|nr:hypothetical protein [Hyphomicrobiales bacterium]